MIVFHILLIILKIVGILLLVILGLVLLLLAVVLFVPIRYRVSAASTGEFTTLTGKVQASWILHLISVKIAYLDRAVKGVVRIAWKKIPIGEDEELGTEPVGETSVEESLPKESDQSQTKDSVVSEDTLPEDFSIVEETPPEKSFPSEGKQPLKPSAEMPQEDVRPKEQQQEEPLPGKTKPTHKPPKEKTSLLDKIKAIFQKIKYTFEKICANIKLLLEKKDHLVAFKDHPSHRNALNVLLREVKKVLGHLRPKKLKADVTFGFDDPYITGQVLAGLGIAYPFMGKDMHITPDFEKQILQGDVFVTGKVRLIHMAAAAIRLLLTKDVRTTYHDIRHFKL